MARFIEVFDELRADLWSSKRDSGHDPKKWADRQFWSFGIWGWNSCWSQWHEAAEWVNLLGIPEIHSDLPWLRDHWNDMNRRLLLKFTLGSCKPWVLVVSICSIQTCILHLKHAWLDIKSRVFAVLHHWQEVNFQERSSITNSGS